MSVRNDEQRRAAAMAAFRLRQQGHTHREIATRLGVAHQHVARMLVLGERLCTREQRTA